MQVTMSNDVTEGEGGDYGGFKIGFHMVGSCRLLSTFIVCTFTLSDVDGLYGAPLPVSNPTCHHLGTVPVNGMLGLVGMDCYAILLGPRISQPVCVLQFLL